MKNRIFIFILIFWNTGFSQEVDSLSIFYYIGYKSSYTIDSKEMRGIYVSNEEMRYKKRKHAYRVDSFVSKISFREWDGGFGPNLITDSIETAIGIQNRSLPAKPLDEFLKAICVIRTDSIFSYEMKDIPASYKREHSITPNSDKKQVDAILRNEFPNRMISNVTGHFFLYFQYQGVSYELQKNSSNPHWSLFIEGKNRDNPYYLIHFAFDAFLLNELPKKFSGKEVLD